jgi:hypothetical protein
MTDVPHWEEMYQAGTPPWDTGGVSSELIRVVQASTILPCRVIELGGGTERTPSVSRSKDST